MQGFHGRLNRKTSQLRNLVAKFHAVIHAITKWAHSWEKKVQKGRQSAPADLCAKAKGYQFRLGECPSKKYDAGITMSGDMIWCSPAFILQQYRLLLNHLNPWSFCSRTHTRAEFRK
jgi:hypothetical protein